MKKYRLLEFYKPDSMFKLCQIEVSKRVHLTIYII